MVKKTSVRLLRLLALLQAPRDWTGSELADRLGVSARTVRHDIERLRSLGYPVTATRGSAGGYRLGAGATMPPLLLDDDEAVAVAVGLRTAATGSIADIGESALLALSKLENVLPTRLRRRVNALHAHTATVPPYHSSPSVDPEVLTLIAGLCRDHERLRFDYESHGGTTTRRDVEPYTLVNWGRRWYLVAYDVDRGDWRTFRVDRMQPVIPTGPRFAPRDMPFDDVTSYVSRNVSAAAWRYRARVTVHAPAETVAARINPTVGTVQPVDEGTCILDTGADTVETLAIYLSLLDADFTVTEPPELVAYLKTLADRYTRAVPPPAPIMQKWDGDTP